MTQSVYLSVRDKKVKAHEGPVPFDGGHLDADLGEAVKWKGKYASGNFVVTFYDVNDQLQQGWPFDGDPPENSQLLVKGDGTWTPPYTLKNTEALWKYDVTVTDGGAAKLDPMIIVRDWTQNFMFVAIPVLAFLVGVVVATFFRRGRTTRSH